MKWGNYDTVHSGIFMFVMVIERAISHQVSKTKTTDRVGWSGKKNTQERTKEMKKKNNKTKEQ